MAGHVFISHASENRDEANELVALIESKGMTAWIAPRDVRPGLDYSEELQRALETCAAFVVLVTPDANTSPYVRAETGPSTVLGLARDNGDAMNVTATGTPTGTSVQIMAGREQRRR